MGGALGAAWLSRFIANEHKSFSEYDPANPIIDVLYHQVPGLTREAHVVHLSDIHFGGPEAYVNAFIFERVIDKVNVALHNLGATPSSTALIMTGDWVSKIEQPQFHIKAPNNGETNPADLPVMFEILRGLQAEHLVATLGNHDHKYTRRQELLRRILQSETHLLDIDNKFYLGDFPIPIMGLPDYTEFASYYTQSQVAEIAKTLNSRDGFKIVASHNASIVDVAGLGKMVTDTHFFFGHTHGGHTKHKILVPYALSDKYKSVYVRGIYKIGNNIVQVVDGLGQHPQATFRQIPAGIIINVYRN